MRVAGPTLPYDGNYHLLWRIDKVRRIALDEAPDVLEVNSPYLAPLCIPGERRGGGITTFWWHADFIDSYARAFVSRFASDQASERLVRPLWALVRKISNQCDATFAAGRHQADKLMEHGVRRVRYLPFGIDKETFRPDARSDRWRAHIYGDLGQVPIIVAVGRLSVEKQWHVVLDGFMRAFGRGQALLLVFGDGPERERLEAIARPRDDVRFMGFEPDRRKLATALASADIFLHGCPHETFGLSVAQAIASGLALVVPDAGGAAELAHPSFSEVYRAGDAEACGKALQRLLGRGLVRMRGEAIEGRGRVLGAKEQVDKTVDAYRELLAARRRDARN